MSICRTNHRFGTKTGEIPIKTEEEPYCGCCNTSNVTLFNLESCKHFLFYVKMFLNIQKMALGMTHICLNCHAIVKKISDFHDMVMDTQNLLADKILPSNRKRKKTCQLTYNQISRINIEPTIDDVKTELITEGEEIDCIKIENAWNNTEFEPKLCSNESVSKTDNTDQTIIEYHENYDELNTIDVTDGCNINKIINQKELNNIDNTDGPYRLNQLIDVNIDDKTNSYEFDKFIDLNKPNHVVLENGVTLPHISKSLKGKRFTLPQLEGDEITCVPVGLAEVLEQFNEKQKSVKYKKMQFKCAKCFIGFSSKIVYESHMEKHIIKEVQLNQHMICDICQCIFLPFYAQSHFISHLIRYQCSQCDKIYEKQRTAKAHYIDAHDKTLRECDLCNFSTNSRRTLRYHKEKTHSGVQCDCNICGKSICNASALKYHILTVHNKESIQLKPCPQCNKLLKPKSLNVHIREVHGAGPNDAFCVECRLNFKTERNLQQHYRHHKNHVDANSSVICDHCGKVFRRKQELITHIMRTHTPVTKTFKCNYCIKTFSLQKDLKIHEKRVHITKILARNHMCDYCGKGFTKAIILKAHVRIHTGERPYKCNICEATFTQSGPLYYHKRLVHLKIKKKK